MGKEIEKYIISNKFNIAGIIDNDNDWNNINENNKIDFAIEFSTPETATNNIIKCFQLNIPVVCGTTAWYNKIDIVKEACKKYDGTLLYGTNFSIGVNLFMQFNKMLVKIMNNFPEYKPTIIESHHTHKLDKPSGTAITLAEDIINFHHEIEKWNVNTGELPANTLPITSVRIGEVKGNHIVRFESSNDIISINHEAKNRYAFAQGAIMAALWLKNKKGIFKFTDYFSEVSKINV